MPLDPVSAALAAVLDDAHVAAIVADREALNAPLSVGEAETVARWCDAYADPNKAAEALVASQYRGCRISAPVKRTATAKAGEAEFVNPPGLIVRADEPAAYALACEMAGWAWKLDWKAATFPPYIADSARLRVRGPNLRLVKS